MTTTPEQPTSPLGSLTKSSAKAQDFLVRVYKPRKVAYSFKSKQNGQMVEKTRFACLLLGEDSGHYCEGSIKGTAEEVTAAVDKFLPRTAWKLSRVCLDNQQQEAFVHTPVRVVVDLHRTRCTPVLKASKEETSLAMAPAPQTTVAQMMNIKSRRCFDVMAAIH